MKRFKEEMANMSEIPMVEQAHRDAEYLVHLEFGDEPVETKHFNMLVIAKLFEKWQMIVSFSGDFYNRPNKRWNSISWQLKSDIHKAQWFRTPQPDLA